ncbi:dTDP-3-amino-3,6-dideoxy-alpha-D-galactopyranose transaminase [mine drainage metagenome]|uniref:dTDP-3-amino-3,6-dideoxy-alpha-D-galactopyranose transaminase n=1 Tax=mine drainage metagenome TaxID=410659 RepID=A0A1J5T4C8_9ZZZZ
MNKVPFLDLKAQYLFLKNEIDNAISSVINETAFIGGKYVKSFEKQFSDVYRVKHCIGVANGTDAIYITLKMLGIGLGDEVITTSSSWISTSETISLTGARPVFVDIDKFYTIDANLIERAITPKTKAIIPVHLYGQPAEMDKIVEIGKKHNLYVIEDCAQSHFSIFKELKVGTFGIASTFSFYPGKNLGAYGDAGCILTNNDTLAEKCRMYANHGALVKHTHLIEGINSRLDGLQAAILSVKLPYIHDWTVKRQENAKLYTSLLKEIEIVKTPEVRNNSEHTFHLYVIKVKDRDNLKKYLYDNGIETAIHYPVALPFMPAYSYLKYTKEDFPKSFAHHAQILSLPMYPELGIESIKYVVETIKSFYKK